MSVLVYSPDGMVSPILYAVAKRYLKDGCDVVVVECESSLNGCSYNLTGDRLVCSYCVKKKDKAKRIIGAAGLKILNIGDYVAQQGARYDVALENFEDFRLYEYKYCDAGYSVISTVVNDLREYEVKYYNKAQRKILKNILVSSRHYVDAVEKIMAEINPEKVVIFNGRLVSTRPMLRFCQKNKITCEVYEITPNGKLNVYENTLPHDDLQFYLKAMDFWNASDESKIESARDFFERKRSGEAVGDYSYTARQRNSNYSLDENGKKNIVIFNSSPDELIAIGDDYSRGLFNSQGEAVEFLCENLNPHEYNVILRIHPNLYGVNSNDMRRLLSLRGEYENLIVIEPQDPLSSYRLLESADKVITFGSTMGVEATYWGKTSILLNKAIWERLHIAHRPSNTAELLRLIADAPAPLNISGSLIYAHYVINYGEEDDIFSWSLFEGSKLNGKSCEPGLFYRIFYGFYKLRVQLLAGNKVFVDKFFLKARKILRG